ncbi:hypothetical protein GGS20DRAFT_486921 [Poronia punctata]|nr:hypothetical protein GGS20DRAFT_486921 [Poronia punctata]
MLHLSARIVGRRFMGFLLCFLLFLYIYTYTRSLFSAISRIHVTCKAGTRSCRDHLRASFLLALLSFLPCLPRAALWIVQQPRTQNWLVMQAPI